MRGLAVVCGLWAAGVFAQTVPFVEERDGAFTSWDTLAQVRADSRGVHVTLLDREERPVRLRWGVEGEDFDVAGLTRSAVDVGYYAASTELYRPASFDVLEARIREGRVVLTRAPDGVHYTLALDGPDSLSALRLFHEGVDAIELADDGSLRLRVGESVLTESAPRCFQRYSGAPASVACAFADVRGTAAAGFTYSVRALGADPSRPIEVDPFFEWNRYLGSEMSKLTSISADPSGGRAVYTSSLRGSVQPDGGLASDVVIGWIQQDGGHQRIRVVSGSGRDEATDSVVDGQGRVVFVGYSWSQNFPNAGNGPPASAIQPDGIFGALDQSGQLVSSGYIASRISAAEEALLSVRHIDGNDFIFGGAVYSDYGGGVKGTYQGGAEGLLLRVRLFNQFFDGWAWHIGGQGDDVITSVDVHPNGTVYAGGFTRSASFAPFAANVGSARAFLVQVLPDAGFDPASALFLGPDAGSLNIRVKRTRVDQVFLAGDFLSQNVITNVNRSDGTPQQPGSGTVDVFLAKSILAADGGRVFDWVDTYSGGADDWLMDLTEDPRNGPLLVGISGSSSSGPFADKDAGAGNYSGPQMGQGANYLMQLQPNGKLRHAGRFGGSRSMSTAADMDQAGNLWVGVTYFPNPGQYIPAQPTFSPDGGGYTNTVEAATVFQFKVPHAGPNISITLDTDGGVHPRDVPLTASFTALEPSGIPISGAIAWFTPDSDPGAQVRFKTFAGTGSSQLSGNLTWPSNSGLPDDHWTVTVQASNADNYDAEASRSFTLTPIPGSEDAGTDGGLADGGTGQTDGGGADGGEAVAETDVSPIGFSCGCSSSASVPLVLAAFAASLARRRRR